MSRTATPYKPGQSAKKPNVSASNAAPSRHAKTLAQQLAAYSDPTPRDVDPEDDPSGQSSAMVTEDYDGEEDGGAGVMRSVDARVLPLLPRLPLRWITMMKDLIEQTDSERAITLGDVEKISVGLK
jgi:hypothetical protein